MVENADLIDAVFFVTSVVILIVFNVVIWYQILWKIVPSELEKLTAMQGRLQEINGAASSMAQQFGVSNKFRSLCGDIMVYYGDVKSQIPESEQVQSDCLQWAGIF